MTVKRSEVTEHEICESGLSIRRHLGHRRADTALLPGRPYGTAVCGFLSVAMAWQIAFLMIGSNPARFRPLMIPGIVEKFGHVAGVAVLYGQGRLSVPDLTAAVPDLLLGVLFMAAFAVTYTSTHSKGPQPARPQR